MIIRRLMTRTATILAAVLAAAAGVVATQLPAYASTCTTSDASGSCGPYDYSQITSSDGNSTYINNNVWSPISGWSESLTAANPGDWSVVANMPAGNTAVVSYPDVQELYNNVPLSSYTSLTSAFTETMNSHSGTMSEAAYDLWLNNWNYEVMIWNDNYGQDLSYDTDLGSVTIGGQNFEVYRNGPGGSGEELIVSLDSNEQSGTIDILSTLKWLEGKGYLPSGATLTSIDYGWEIASTGGKSETYQLSSFCIDENGGTKCSAGGSSSSPTSPPSSQAPTTAPPTQTTTTAPPTQTPTTAPPTQTTTTAPPTQAPTTAPPTQTATSAPPTQTPPSQTSPVRNPLWFWLVTRTPGGADVLLPAPWESRAGLPLRRHDQRQPLLAVGFPS
jgi:Glycosyl hydrolase family 12